MSRQGLMDDCGYHDLDECARYEECSKETYEKGKEDGKEELFDELIEMLGSESTATVGRYELISNLERMKRSK